MNPHNQPQLLPTEGWRPGQLALQASKAHKRRFPHESLPQAEDHRPQRRRLLDLTEVYFRISAYYNDEPPLRQGSLSAFMLRRDVGSPVPKHYFTFGKFSEWINARVPDLQHVVRWKALIDGQWIAFDEDASWDLMICEADKLLQQLTQGENMAIQFIPDQSVRKIEEWIEEQGRVAQAEQHVAITDKERLPGDVEGELDVKPNVKAHNPLKHGDVVDLRDVESSESSDEGSDEDPEMQTAGEDLANKQVVIVDKENDHHRRLANSDELAQCSEAISKKVQKSGEDLNEPPEQTEATRLVDDPSAQGLLRPAAPSHVDHSQDDPKQHVTKPEIAQSSLNAKIAQKLESASREQPAIVPVFEDDLEGLNANNEHDSDVNSDDELQVRGPQDQPLKDNRIAPTQQILFNQNFLTEAQWVEVCTVLDHPVHERSGGKQLMGTRQKLMIHQMAFIVRALKTHHVEPKLNGLLVADNVGLGKSVCALGLFAVNSLILLNLRHRRKFPHLHLDAKAEVGEICPSGSLYGIQCVCVPEGIARHYGKRLVGGPSVITVPASNLDAWANRIAAYFHREIRVQGSDVDESLIEPVYYRESGQLTSIMVDGTKADIDRSQMLATVGQSTEELPFKPKKNSKGKRVRSKKSETMSYDQFRKEYGDSVELRFKAPKLIHGQFRFLILVSYQAYGNPQSALERLFGSQVSFHQKTSPQGQIKGGSKSVLHVLIPFAVAVTLVVFDESHSVVSPGSRLFTAFRNAQRLSTVTDRRQPHWSFMSATPFSHSPSDILACLDLLIADPAHRADATSGLPILATRFKRLQTAQKQGGEQPANETYEFALSFAKFVRPLVVARDWGSPFLDTCLKDTRPGISRRLVRLSVPEKFGEVVERLGERVRMELSQMRAEKKRDLDLAEVTGVPVFTQYFSAGIMPGIAAITESGRPIALPSSAKEIDEDFKLGKKSVLRAAAHFHYGHKWTQELINILREAHSREERPRHVLLVAQTPSLVGHLVHFIEKDPTLSTICKAIRIFQAVTPKAAGRDTFLRLVAGEASQSDLTYVLVTTPRLVGVGIDIVFCSVIVQFGEIYSNREREQLIGRVHRPGQTLEVLHYHIMSTHKSHEVVRKRNAGRSVMLSEQGLWETSESSEDEV